MNPYKDYGSITKSTLLMGGAWSYEATTMITVPAGTYELIMELTAAGGVPYLSSPPRE
jgi:hypothetical protein